MLSDEVADEALSRVRERVAEKMRVDPDFLPSVDDPSFRYLFVDLLIDVLGLVWVVTAAISAVVQLFGTTVSPIAWGVAGGAFLLSLLLRIPLHRWRKEARVGEVLLARVVQCYVPGWGPPEDDPSDNPYFTGIVTYSFDPRVSPLGLDAVVELCGAVKHADEPGEFAAVSAMLRRGDTEFVRESQSIPAEVSGASRTLIADAFFDRGRLPKEHLVTPWIFIFVDEEQPHRVQVLDRELWEDAFAPVTEVDGEQG